MAASDGQIVRMNISIILDTAFDGHADRMVWIIDTPQNRRWFERQIDLEPASAIFSADRYPTQEAAAVQMVWNAQDHTPGWTTIDVIGAQLADQIAVDLDGEGPIVATPMGFRLDRL
jgi:hypothetical protein